MISWVMWPEEFYKCSKRASFILAINGNSFRHTYRIPFTDLTSVGN